MAKIKSLTLNIFADYFQFYIQDEAAAGDLSQSWDEEAVARLFAFAPGTVGIGTVRNTGVPIVMEIHDHEPRDDLSEWDHVVEASLDVPSGKVVIAGCTDYFPDAMRLDVPPGCYRVRVSYGSLDALSEDKLSGDDHYRLQLWPGIKDNPQVLKQRPK